MSFVIEINEANKDVILDRIHTFSNPPKEPLKTYLAQSNCWYFATYLESERGKLMDWTIMPASFAEEKFYFDKEEAKTQMTLITHK